MPQCSEAQNKTDRPGRPGHQKQGSAVQKQNAMFKNTQQSHPVRAARAPEVPECCAKAKHNVQKHTKKLAATKFNLRNHDTKVNIDFSDVCKRHDSGIVGGWDLRHLSIETLAFWGAQKIEVRRFPVHKYYS